MHKTLIATFCISLVPLSIKANSSICSLTSTDKILAVDLPHRISEDSIPSRKKKISQTHELGTAQVLGHSVTHQLKYSPQTVSIVGARQLQGTASSLLEVIGRVAGVTIRTTGGVGSSSRISVRGLEGKRMGVFVDDYELSQVGNYVSIDDIPTDMIERVEIYKGIVPYRLGGSALGGAVNVVTKEYPPRYLDASYEVGSCNTHRFNTVFKRNFSRSGIELGVGGLHVFSDNDYRMTLRNLGGMRVRRDHDSFKKTVVGGSVKATKWWFDELKMELIGTHTHQEVQGVELNIRHAYNHAKSVLAELTAKRNGFFLPYLDFDFAAALNIGQSGQIDTAKVVHRWDGTITPSASSLGGEATHYPSFSKDRSTSWISRLNLNYGITPEQFINLNVYNAGTNTHPKNDIMERALGYKISYNSRLNSLTTGLSYDCFLFNHKLQTALTLKNFHISSTAVQFENYFINQPDHVHISRTKWGGNFAMAFRPHPEWLLKASVSSEVRIPSNEEIVGNGYAILPSPGLHPERNNGVNLGMLFHRNLQRGGMLEVEVNGFHSHLIDMIRFVPGIIPSTSHYANFGAVTTFGIEGEIKWDILPSLYLYANATLQNLRDVRKLIPETTVPNPTYKKRIPNVPYLLANWGGEFHRENLFGGKGQNTRFLVDASYVHQYFYDFELSAYQDRKIPTSVTWDAGIEHSFNNRRWTITLKVKNLTNKEVVSELNHPLPGRNFSVKLRYLLH